jgi:excisionase family DNA binding protein
MADSAQFLTTEEASKLLNVHQNTIVRWIKTGAIPSSKIGREYRIPREAIENRVNRVKQGTRIIAISNQKGGLIFPFREFSQDRRGFAPSPS